MSYHSTTQLSPRLSSEQARIIAVPSVILIAFLLPFFFVPSSAITTQTEIDAEAPLTWFETQTWYSQPEERPFQVTGLGTFERVKFSRVEPQIEFVALGGNLLNSLFVRAGGDELLYAGDLYVESYVEEATGAVEDIQDDVAAAVSDVTGDFPVRDFSDLL